MLDMSGYGVSAQPFLLSPSTEVRRVKSGIPSAVFWDIRRKKTKLCSRFTLNSVTHPRDQNAVWNPNVRNSVFTQPTSSLPYIAMGAAPLLSWG